ncbi:hypothetical protein GCM10028801_30450 [Nocardioides maradonensis]
MTNRASGFCEAGNCRQCRGHFHPYGLTPAWDCVCACHRLDGLLQRMGVKKAVVLLEECERCP